jgi:hypothetical protein
MFILIIQSFSVHRGAFSFPCGKHEHFRQNRRINWFARQKRRSTLRTLGFRLYSSSVMEITPFFGTPFFGLHFNCSYALWDSTLCHLFFPIFNLIKLQRNEQLYCSILSSNRTLVYKYRELLRCTEKPV